jgi:hypothetical protein
MMHDFVSIALGMFLGAMLWDILKEGIKKVVKKW